METSFKNTIYQYIIEHYTLNEPVQQKDIYEVYNSKTPSIIRKNLSMLCEENKLVRVSNGIYAIPDKTNIFKGYNVSTNDIIDSKYLFDRNNKVIGYMSGLNFSNILGLTTQTASIPTIVSNVGPRDKRLIQINKRKYVVLKSKVSVTDENYKLLQVLDLLLDFDLYSEYPLNDSFDKIKNYLADLKLDIDEIEHIVSLYPLESQVKFYKLGGPNVVTRK